MKTKKVEVSGQSIVVSYAVVNQMIWIHSSGETYAVPLALKKTLRGTKSHDLESGDILAPMPGKVTQVLASVGARVLKGQTLVVMEAMKMEYNLKAPADLEVLRVNAKVGEQVPLGHLLVSGQLGAKS